MTESIAAALRRVHFLSGLSDTFYDRLALSGPNSFDLGGRRPFSSGGCSE